MLSQKTMDSLAAISGVKADELAQAISDEQEKELELPEGRFLTKEKEETLLDNHGKRKYDEGKSKALKDIFEGKSKEDYLEDYKKSVLEDAKLEPNKKIAEKEEALKALQKKYETDISEWTNKYQGLETKLNGVNLNTKISNLLPSELPVGLTREDATMIVANNFQFKEGQVYKNGEVLRDDLQNPITMQDAIKGFVEERKWSVQKPKGRGSQKPSFKGVEPKNYDEFVQLCESKNISPGSIEGKQLLKKFAEKNPEFFNE